MVARRPRSRDQVLIVGRKELRVPSLGLAHAPSLPFGLAHDLLEFLLRRRHLFAQGVTSTELLLRDETFRKDAAKKVEKVDAEFANVIPNQPGARDQIRVSYVILSRGKRRDRPYGLPFFSMVSLKSAAERLSGAGIDVSVKEVKEA
jgi:hypothetical protein